MNLEDLILKRYPLPEWVALIEVRASTGYGKGSDQRYDAVALNCYPSKGHLRAVFEVKRTRHDFMRELEDPGKRKQAETYFHETWFVTSPGVCEPSEVPEGWGLLVATKSGGKLLRKRAAMQRTPKEAPWGLALSMLRQQQEITQRAHRTLENNISAKFNGEEVSEEYLQKLAYEYCMAQRTSLEIALDKTLSEHKRLTKAQKELRSPLNHLGHLCGHYGIADYSTLTVEKVEELLTEAVSRRLKQITVHISDAHKAIGNLVQRLEQ